MSDAGFISWGVFWNGVNALIFSFFGFFIKNRSQL